MACLRTSYTATHSRQELDYALEKLRKVGTELGLIGPRAPGAPIDIRAVGEEKGDQMIPENCPGRFTPRTTIGCPR